MTDTPTDRPKSGQKTALVTGAGVGGIGGSLATKLHEAGYFVICAVRRRATAEPLVRPGIIIVEMDVASTESVEKAAHLVSFITGGRLDVLVNNAGVAAHRPVLELDIDGMVTDMFNVNVLGVMRATKSFSNLLIEAKGCIVNIGSIAPIAPLVFSSAYNATKAALHAYGDSLSMEMKPFGVSVVTIVTGGVKSNFVREDTPRLPTDSLFLPVEKFWQQRVVQSQDGAMNTDEYAARVVSMIVKKNKPLWFWAGNKAFVIRILYYILPRWLRLNIMANRSGLNILKRAVQKQEADKKSV